MALGSPDSEIGFILIRSKTRKAFLVASFHDMQIKIQTVRVFLA
jgi:hypothetical protein